MQKVFLGGTVNGSTWRDYIMERLEIDYFNPVVPNWNDEAYEKELYERKTCDYCLYVITPKMTGFYSIAEVVDDSNRRPDKTIYCLLNNDDGTVFTPHQIKSLKAVGKMVVKNGGKWFETIDDIIEFLNSTKNK